MTSSSQDSPHFPNAFYRVVAKGLCVRDGKLLLVKDFSSPFYREAGGLWELPGGGLDFGEKPHEALRREIQEEMGLEATFVEEKPTYFWTYKRLNKRNMPWHWVFILGLRFEVANLDFTPTDECREIEFFSLEEMGQIPTSDQTGPLLKLFKPEDFK